MTTFTSARLDRPPRVFVVAPQLSGWGLQRMVDSAHPAVELSGYCDLDAAEACLEDAAVDVVLVDADDPDVIASLPALVTETRRVLLVTSCVDDVVLDQAVLGGLHGVVRKNDSRELLLKAIDRVYAGQLWIDRSSTGRLFVELARQKSRASNDPEHSRIASLTMRERQTIAAVTVDASAPAKVVAERLCISPHTLRNHLTSIYSKLGVTSRLDLYAYATRHGLGTQQHRVESSRLKTG